MEQVFGWYVVNSISREIVTCAGRKDAEKMAQVRRDEDMGRACRFPKGSPYVAAMRRRAEAYRVARMVYEG